VPHKNWFNLPGTAAWFFLANALTPLIAIALGPLVLRKVGLEEYALLGITTYFFNLINAYSDFSISTHLLASYSKRDPNRHADLGNALVLKASIWAGFVLLLCAAAILVPRPGGFYPLLAISMGVVILPTANLEWFFLARKRYAQIFVVRIAGAACYVLLTLAWFFSPWRSVLFVPAIGLGVALTGSVVLLRYLGRERLLQGLGHLRLVSWPGLRAIFLRLLPVSAVLLLVPYFLAYALPWYSLVCPDKKLVGAFSIGYRLVIGAGALVVPMILYFVSTFDSSSGRPPFRRVLAGSVAVCALFWGAGFVAVHFYFAASRVDPGLLGHALETFSILTLGMFFLCLRMPYVAEYISTGRYGRYFLIHLAACAPVLAISWLGGRSVPPHLVAWLACIPEFLVAMMFLFIRPRANVRPAGAS
jgi:O-antigen/teichoic acid export membrane protein